MRVLDPYLRWADATGGKYLAYGSRESRIFAVQLAKGRTVEEVAAIAGVRLRTTPRSGDDPFSAFFSIEMAAPDAARLGELTACSNFVLAEPGMRPAGTAPTSGARRHDAPHRGSAAVCSQDVVFAVIDGRCAFANERFCERTRPSSSLIDYFWDQGADVQPGWSAPAGVSYGRELDRERISAALADAIPDALGARPSAERNLYRALGHALPTDCDWSHGTHVLDTVLTDFRSATGWDRTAHCRPGVIYVQLADEALRDTSGRWMAANVLDALHYVVARAGENARVVVNLSLGSFAGPHDGSSLLEQAIDALVASRNGRLAVVVAAGNARRVTDDATGERKSCRARHRLEPVTAAQGNAVQLQLAIDCQDDTETFLELWIRPTDPAQGRPTVAVSLRPPPFFGGAPGAGILATPPGSMTTRVEGGETTAAVINDSGSSHAPNGADAMVLVAIGHTRDTRGGRRAHTGPWTVTAANQGATAVIVDAWIERRDIPGELIGERPQYGFSPATAGSETLNSLATLANGTQTLVVGAVEQSEGQYRPSDYSSTGESGDAPNRSNRAPRVPFVFAPGQRRSAGFLTGSHKSLRGTSMASAQVAASLGAAFRAEASDASSGALEGFVSQVRGQALKRAREAARTNEPPSVVGGSEEAFVLPAIAESESAVPR